MKAAHGRRRWVANAGAYTLGGIVTSAAIGSGLALAGAALFPPTAEVGIAIAVAVASVALAREVRWSGIPLPQVRRQTCGQWSRRLSPRVAPVLWGLDLGLFFTTWLTFAGTWLVVALAVVAGSPAFGAGLFVAYWLGRSLGVWLAPLLLVDATATPALMSAIDRQFRLFQLAHAGGLVLAIAVLLSMHAQSVSL